MTDSRDPDSWRQLGPAGAEEELRYMRRSADRQNSDRIVQLADAVSDLRAAVTEIKQMFADHVEAGEQLLLTRAAERAVALVFSHLGVDVDSPSDLQRFRDDLRFGAMVRASAQKGLFAVIAGVGAAAVSAVWYGIRNWGEK